MACDTIRLANLIRNGAKVLRIILLLPNDALIQPLCFLPFRTPLINQERHMFVNGSRHMFKTK